MVKEIQNAVTKASESFESFGAAGEQFEKVGVEVEGAVNSADDTIKAAKDAVVVVKGAVSTIDKAFQSAERTIQNVEKFSEPLGERGDEIVQQVVTSLRKLGCCPGRSAGVWQCVEQ